LSTQGSPLQGLRARLHFELARCELSADFLDKAAEHLASSRRCDHGLVNALEASPEAPSVDLLGDLVKQLELDAAACHHEMMAQGGEEHADPLTVLSANMTQFIQVGQQLEGGGGGGGEGGEGGKAKSSTSSSTSPSLASPAAVALDEHERRRNLDARTVPLELKLTLKKAIYEEPEAEEERALLSLEQAKEVTNNPQLQSTLLAQAAALLEQSQQRQRQDQQAQALAAATSEEDEAADAAAAAAAAAAAGCFGGAGGSSSSVRGGGGSALNSRNNSRVPQRARGSMASVASSRNSAVSKGSSGGGGGRDGKGSQQPQAAEVSDLAAVIEFSRPEADGRIKQPPPPPLPSSTDADGQEGGGGAAAAAAAAAAAGGGGDDASAAPDKKGGKNAQGKKGSKAAPPPAAAAAADKAEKGGAKGKGGSAGGGSAAIGLAASAAEEDWASLPAPEPRDKLRAQLWGDLLELAWARRSQASIPLVHKAARFLLEGSGSAGGGAALPAAAWHPRRYTSFVALQCTAQFTLAQTYASLAANTSDRDLLPKYPLLPPPPPLSQTEAEAAAPSTANGGSGPGGGDAENGVISQQEALAQEYESAPMSVDESLMTEEDKARRFQLAEGLRLLGASGAGEIGGGSGIGGGGGGSMSVPGELRDLKKHCVGAIVGGLRRALRIATDGSGDDVSAAAAGAAAGGRGIGGRGGGASAQSAPPPGSPDATPSDPLDPPAAAAPEKGSKAAKEDKNGGDKGNTKKAAGGNPLSAASKANRYLVENGCVLLWNLHMPLFKKKQHHLATPELVEALELAERALRLVMHTQNRLYISKKKIFPHLNHN
jgi:hypothetical protein